ncbi:hypothetical protein [Chitinimonas sp.]|uniref:hypothetical protein n=1 Tax=Chitinimonas sp. TaxID=1934313 RepID=UPI0035B44953
MSEPSTPAVTASSTLQYRPSAAAVQLECLCQLQEMGGFQQMASAIAAGDLERAQRSYQTLLRRAPRPADAATEISTPLTEQFEQLGLALQVQDPARAARLMQNLQHMVETASQQHRHGRRNTGGAVAAAPRHIIDIKV